MLSSVGSVGQFSEQPRALVQSFAFIGRTMSEKCPRYRQLHLEACNVPQLCYQYG